jgi:hypothetical protein
MPLLLIYPSQPSLGHRFCLDQDLAIAILRHRHKSRIDLLYYALAEPHVIIPLGVIQSSYSSAILIAYFCSCLFLRLLAGIDPPGQVDLAPVWSLASEVGVAIAKAQCLVRL